MFKDTAKKLVNLIHYVHLPIIRTPDFTETWDGWGYYVQVIIKNRTFLIKGQGKFSLIEIGLGASKIGFKTIEKNMDALDIGGTLMDIRNNT